MKGYPTPCVRIMAHFLPCGLRICSAGKDGWITGGMQGSRKEKITFAFQQIWSVMDGLCLISFTSHFIGLVPTEMCSELVRGHNVTRSRARLTRSVCPQRVTPASAEPRVVVCSQRASGWRRLQTSRFTQKEPALGSWKSPSRAPVSSNPKVHIGFCAWGGINVCNLKRKNPTNE